MAADYFAQNGSGSTTGSGQVTGPKMTPEEMQAALQAAELQRQQLANQLAQSQLPDVKEQAALARSRAEREKDLQAGRTRGQELFGTTSDQDATNITNRVRASAEGFTPQELTAMREQNLGTIQSAGKQNMRALRIQQAANGVRGSQAVAQQGRLANDQQNQIVGSERELFLKNIDARKQGLQNFQDLANREKAAKLTTELGYGSLGAADRGAVMQSIVGQQQAAAAARSQGGGGKK